MASQRNSTSPQPELEQNPGRRLLVWPVALAAATLAMLLIANTVSAWGSRDEHDVDDFKAHAEHFVDRMLRKIDASEEQNVQIQQIIDATIDELAALHENRSPMRAEFAVLMTADIIDREAIEALRASHLARADQMSRIVSASLADVMDVLTVEQRSELEERLGRHHRRHGRGWH